MEIAKPKYYHTERRTWSPKEMADFWSNFEGCKKVLDLGCGIGLFGKYKPEGVEVFGADVDKLAVKEAATYEREAKWCDAMKKIPYPEKFFDGVLMKDLLEHVIYPWEVMKNVIKVLKPGGIVLATVPSPRKKAWDDYSHVRPFTERAITELFLDNGFEIMSVKRLLGIPGFGRLGISWITPYLLKIPVVSWLTEGYMVKARKPE